MNISGPENLNKILLSVEKGNAEASTELLPLIYHELRNLARSLMAQYPPGQTLQATALVHEAYLRLNLQDDLGWNSRGHFFGAAAQAMRRILVEQARRKKRKRHGGEMQRVDLEIEDLGIPQYDIDFLALDYALDELKVLGERKVNVVLLRYLAGLSLEETAAALEVSTSTVDRDWRFSRAFLLGRLNGNPRGNHGVSHEL